MDENETTAKRMFLPDDWQQRFATKLSATIKDAGVCRMCGNQSLIISEHAVSPLVWKDNVVHAVGMHYPQAMLLCQSCGNTTYYNLVLMGILDESPKTDHNDG